MNSPTGETPPQRIPRRRASEPRAPSAGTGLGGPSSSSYNNASNLASSWGSAVSATSLSRSLPRGRTPNNKKTLPPAPPSGAPRRAFAFRARSSSVDSLVPRFNQHGNNSGLNSSIGQSNQQYGLVYGTFPRSSRRSRSWGPTDRVPRPTTSSRARSSAFQASALSRAVDEQRRIQAQAQKVAKAAAAAARERKRQLREAGEPVAESPELPESTIATSAIGQPTASDEEDDLEAKELEEGTANHPCTLFFGHPPPRFTRALWFVEASASMALFVDMLVYGIVVPILPELVVDKLHLGDREVGFLFASYSLGYLVLSPVVGFLSDKYRTRRLPMLFGITFLAMATIMFGTFAANSYALLLAARTIQGCAGASIWSVAVASLADVYPPDRLTSATSRVLTFNTAGFLLGPVVGGVLYQAGGMALPFNIAAGLALVDLVLWFLVDLHGARMEVKRTAVEEEEEVGDEEGEEEDVEGETAGSDERDPLLASSAAPNTVATPTSAEVRDVDVSNTTSPPAPINYLNDAELVSPPTEEPPMSDLKKKKKDLTVRVGEQADTFFEPAAGAEEEEEEEEGEEEGEDLEGDEEEGEESNEVDTVAILRLLLRPELLVVLAASAVNATLFSGIEPTLPVHLSSRFNAPSSTIGLMFIAIEIPNTLVRLALGPVCDNYFSGRSRRFLSAFGLVIFGASAPLMGLVTPQMGIGWIVPALLAFGASESVYSTPIYSEIANIVRVHADGEGYGTVCG